MKKQNVLSKFNFHIHRLCEQNYYRKVSKDLLLDGRLSFNDKIVYISLLYFIPEFSDNFVRVKSDNIYQMGGIVRTNQKRSIIKLVDLGYIDIFNNDSNSLKFKIREPKQYIRILLDQIESMSYSKKLWIQTLIGLILSNGHNKIPSFNTSLEKFKGTLGWPSWRNIKRNYGTSKNSDIVNYNNLMYSDIGDLINIEN